MKRVVAAWSNGPKQARLGLALGLLTLLIVATTFPLFSRVGSRPLAAFALPGLVTAILAGWRATLAVEVVSLLTAVVYGRDDNLTTASLWTRWGILAAVGAVAVLGAVVRERQNHVANELEVTNRLLQTFERGLAPKPLAPPSFLVVTRYRSSDARMRLSGDFLEAIALPDGRLAVLIGDVCGHGASQAAFGTALRAGWKSIALTEKADPADWLESLDRAFFADGRFDGFATVCSGIIDEDSPSQLAVAGHPRPVALGSRATVVDAPIGPPLGVGHRGGWEIGTFIWDRAPLLFYTDGLVENPKVSGPPARWGDSGLIRWIDGRLPLSDPRTFVDTLITDATSGRDLRDDVAVLLVTASIDVGGA